MTHAQAARITTALALALSACGDDAVGSDTDTSDESSTSSNTNPSTSNTTNIPGTSDGPETTDDPMTTSTGGTPTCGDGIVDPGEDCDDHGASALCNADCTTSACGDGIVNALAGEQCDDAGRSTACNDDCTLTECGDGVVNASAGEDCDDSGESASCNDDCTNASCGDGVLNESADEDCDDGGESASCNVDCSLAACGDGITNVSSGEECDGAGRSAACNDDCTNASCGDGILNTTAGEACDDGGESATCNVDCSDASCGDGITNITAGEDCDDAGESLSCDTDCSPAACGDGITNITAGEGCDGGGESATCDTDCTPAACGDGLVNVTAGEDCEGGDCSAACQFIGKVIWIGHDLFARNADVDQVIGNAVLMANGAGTIDVLGYNEFADTSPTGEVANTNAAIMDEATAAGEVVTITQVSDDALVAAMLPSYDVFLIYEMELGGDGAGIGAGLAGALQSFLDDGGTVIAMDFFTQGALLLDGAGAMRFLGQYTGYGTTSVTVTATHPLMTGVPTPTYTGTDGTASFWTNDGTVLAVDQAGLPVVVYKEWNERRFDGSVGAWQARANSPDATYSAMTYHPTHVPNIYNMFDSGAAPATGTSYDPATNTWSPLPAAMPANNPWFQVAPVGRLLFGFVAYTNQLWRFDIATNSWTQPTTFVGTAEYPMAAADERGAIYGYVSEGNVVRYDPSLNSVTYHPTGLGSLYESRVVYDPTTGLLYLGGYSTSNLYSFDVDSGVTTPLSSIPEVQLNDIFCGDRSGHIYAAGDFGGTTMWQYDIATDTWLSLPDLPVDHGNNGSCVVSDTGYLYVGNGSSFGWYRLPLY